MRAESPGSPSSSSLVIRGVFGMNCQGCGHNFPNTLTRCPRCKVLSSRRIQRASDSRLIEFPRKTRLAQEPESNDAALPKWRQDLNEKVRAIRARRSNPATASAAPVVRAEESIAAVAQHEGRNKGRTITEPPMAVP